MKAVTIIPASATRPEIEITAYGDIAYREFSDTTGRRIIDISIARSLRRPATE